MAGGEGATFGKYYLLKKIAAGGMGEIYLAKLKGPVGFEKILVIKRILAHHLENQEFVDMFFAEARVAAQLSHSNIVQIYEMGEIEDCYFIGMEYVHGKPLRNLIDRVREINLPIHPAHAIEVIGKLCEGMSYAHNATDMVGDDIGIIHRDINPHNLLVSYAGDVKIIDFGIAKSEMSMHKTETGTIKGKFVYMSPEQSAAEELDKRSDLFAIGICLYETLAGFNPFAKANIVLSLDAIQRHDPEPLSSIRPELAPFDPIIRKALAKKPEDRYADCADFRDELQGLLNSGAVPHPTQTLSEVMRDIFRNEIDAEKRMIVATDQASSQQVEAMRLATRFDHSSGSYRRAVKPEPGVVVEGSTEIGWAQGAAPNDNESATLAIDEPQEPRSRALFYLMLAAVVLASLVGVAAVLKLGSANRSHVTSTLVEEISPDADTANNADVSSKPDEPNDGADSTPLLETPKPSAAVAAANTKGDDSKVDDGGRRRGNRRGQKQVESAQGSPSKEPADSRHARPSPPPPPPPPTPQPHQKSTQQRAHRKPPPPAPVATGFGTIYISVTPPTKIFLGERSVGQTLQLKNAVGVLQIGTGSDASADPFKVKVRYRADKGSITYTVDAEPWAIVRGNGGIGLGRTPLPPTQGEGSTVFELQNPQQGLKQRLTLRYAPP